jgi:pilus assembly protein CpaC
MMPGTGGTGVTLPVPMPAGPGMDTPLPSLATPELAGPVSIEGTIAQPRIINLLRVPGSQQVLLKVRVAELNRSAMRQIGANFLGVDPSTGAIVGSQIAGTNTALGRIGSVTASSGTTTAVPARQLIGGAAAGTSVSTTIFGIFQDANFEFTLNALRRNAFL